MADEEEQLLSPELAAQLGPEGAMEAAWLQQALRVSKLKVRAGLHGGVFCILADLA